MKEENHSKALFSGIFAFLFWGFVPLYWKQLNKLPAYEIMSYRVISSLIFMVLILSFQKEMMNTLNLLRKRFLMVFLASCLVGFNWLIYVWAVNAGHIVETSLGYFINPLINVALGVIFLHERPRKTQWFAILLAFIGVIFLASKGVGKPWIALAVAGSFGLYGLVKKQLKEKSIPSLAAENFILLPLGISYLIYIWNTNSVMIIGQSSKVYLFAIISGLTTLLPLATFTYAVKKLNLTTVGIIQYLAPTFQLVIGVYVYNEEFTKTHMISFSFIWLALLIFTIDGVSYSMRSRERVRKILAEESQHKI